MIDQDITFSVNEETLSWIWWRILEKDYPDIMFFHGAWWSNKDRTKYIAQALSLSWLSSFGFDFSGHGTSTGSLRDSCLSKRIQEATVAMNLFIQPPHIVIGSSMWWYVALQLLKQFPIDTLILFAPAVYADDAMDIQFDHTFSDAIRKPDSWKESTLWDELSLYTGKVLLFIWSEDEVIPSWVIEYIDRCTSCVSRKEIVVIPDCPHAIHRHIAHDSELIHTIVEKIHQFIIK